MAIVFARSFLHAPDLTRPASGAGLLPGRPRRRRIPMSQMLREPMRKPGRAALRRIQRRYGQRIGAPPEVIDGLLAHPRSPTLCGIVQAVQPPPIG